MLHIAILAYLASFVLIRYRLSDAEKQVTLCPTDPIAMWDAYIDLRCMISVQQVPLLQFLLCGMVPRKKQVKSESEALATPDDAVATLRSMVTMLIRCHTTIALMTQLGFILALLGILAYFWTGLPQVLGIWATVLLGGCLFGMGAAIV